MVFFKILKNSPESTCARASLLIKFQGKTCKFITNETPAHVFCKISKNTFYVEHTRATASTLSYLVT